jgi:hypothetical protein
MRPKALGHLAQVRQGQSRPTASSSESSTTEGDASQSDESGCVERPAGGARADAPEPNPRAKHERDERTRPATLELGDGRPDVQPPEHLSGARR